MTEREKYEYWLEYAKADLDTAEFMVESRRWLYVSYMCQQAIEKLVKGLFGLYINFDDIPRVHNITRLINDFADKLPQAINRDTLDFFNLLSDYYLNNRYPEYIQQLKERMAEGNSREVLIKTKEAFAWLLTLTPSELK